MRKSLHPLAAGVLVLGAAVLVSSVTPAQAGLERRPALAFPELDQPPSPSCAAPCASARIDQPGAGVLDGGSVDGASPGGEAAGTGGDGSGGVDSGGDGSGANHGSGKGKGKGRSNN